MQANRLNGTTVANANTNTVMMQFLCPAQGQSCSQPLLTTRSRELPRWCPRVWNEVRGDEANDGAAVAVRSNTIRGGIRRKQPDSNVVRHAQQDQRSGDQSCKLLQTSCTYRCAWARGDARRRRQEAMGQGRICQGCAAVSAYVMGAAARRTL